MSPMLVLKDGRPVLAIGAAGGRTIINNVFQTLVSLMAPNKSLERASLENVMTVTRFHIETAEPVHLEMGADALAAGLMRLGHQVQMRPRFGSLQAIRLGSEPGVMAGVADPRRAGTVAWS